MTLVSDVTSTSITVLDTHKETLKDICKARLVNDTMKSQIKCFESVKEMVTATSFNTNSKVKIV